MKRKMICLPLLLAALASLPSCKKEYSCTCTVVTQVSYHDYYEENGQQQEDVEKDPATTSTTEVNTDKVKKKDAGEACAKESNVSESNFGGTIMVGGFKEGYIEKTTKSSTCTLK